MSPVTDCFNDDQRFNALYEEIRQLRKDGIDDYAIVEWLFDRLDNATRDVAVTTQMLRVYTHP